MTIPGGDAGDKPNDQTGEGVSGGSNEVPDQGPSVEQGAPPAYEHPAPPTPPDAGFYGVPTPPPYPPQGGYAPQGYPPPPDPNYPPPGYPDPASAGQYPPPPPPHYGPPDPHYGPPDPQYGAPYPGGGYPAPGPYGYGYGQPQQTKTNTMAIASLVISILGIVPFCGGILSIVGIVLGTVALSQIKETRQEGYGLAIAGIVVGVAMLIIGLIWTIFALR